MLRNMARLRQLHAVRRVARNCGRLDAAGELGSLGMAWLRSARQQAREGGCSGDSIDTMTLDGLDLGRAPDEETTCHSTD
jgi:hypothetical protein